MKKQLLLIAYTLISFSLTAQKTKVTVSEFVKNKKGESIEGFFTIDDKPFLLVAESKGMIVDYNAVFYPVKNDNTLGEPIKQEDVRIVMGELHFQKSPYIERIIVNNGQTYAFFSVREGTDITVYYCKLNDDCQINIADATEVMNLKISPLSKSTDFAVRVSPDNSKIMLVGMNRGSAKKSKFFFKVYTAGMGQMIWEKSFEASRTNDAMFGGRCRYSTMNESENLAENFLLINNEGRAYFLSDWSNPSGHKHDLQYISIDPTGKTMTEAEVPFKGEYYVRQIFRLTAGGHANLILYYNTEKIGLQPTNQWGAEVNAFSFQEYDGSKVVVKADYNLSEEVQGTFFPAKFRKPKSDYRVGGYEIARVLELPNSEFAVLMYQNFSTVGTERPFSNTAHGFTCVMVIDSNYKIKNTYSYVCGNKCSPKMFFWPTCNLSYNGTQLTLYFKDEDNKAMRVNLYDSKAKPESFGAAIEEADAIPQLSFILFRKDDLLIPLMKDKNQFGMAHVK